MAINVEDILEEYISIQFRILLLLLIKKNIYIFSPQIQFSVSKFIKEMPFSGCPKYSPIILQVTSR